MLPRDESIEDKFKTLLTVNPLGATVRNLTSASEIPG
jgi:hypothetical protein